jgi:hypothetical protein
VARGLGLRRMLVALDTGSGFGVCSGFCRRMGGWFCGCLGAGAW